MDTAEKVEKLKSVIAEMDTDAVVRALGDHFASAMQRASNDLYAGMMAAGPDGELQAYHIRTLIEAFGMGCITCPSCAEMLRAEITSADNVTGRLELHCSKCNYTGERFPGNDQTWKELPNAK